jgi:hypothetical protein
MDTYELIDSPALRPALPKTFWWALASIVLMPVGAFGPWATLLGVLTVSGTDDNAGWTVVGSAATAAIALGSFVRWRRRWLCIVPLLAAAAGAATATYNIRDISSLNTSFDGADLVSTEWGVYVALVGSISLLLASLVLGVQTKSPAERVAIPGSTRTAKLRSPWGVFFLATVTFGVYGLYWYYQANRELKDYGVGSSPLRSLLAQFPGALLIVPALCLVVALLWADPRGGGSCRLQWPSRPRCWFRPLPDRVLRASVRARVRAATSERAVAARSFRRARRGAVHEPGSDPTNRPRGLKPSQARGG